jgi:hypothetical protein
MSCDGLPRLSPLGSVRVPLLISAEAVAATAIKATHKSIARPRNDVFRCGVSPVMNFFMCLLVNRWLVGDMITASWRIANEIGRIAL